MSVGRAAPGPGGRLRARPADAARRVVLRYGLTVALEDDRVRQARLGSGLLLLGAGSALVLLPLLPVRIERELALLLAGTCLLLGAVIPWLPWQRWPYAALLAPTALTLPLLFVGGFVGGDLDYYALFLPLLFLYSGFGFPPRHIGWLLGACLAGLAVCTLRPQVPGVVPFVLLGSVLSSVCGLVLSLQRRDDQRAATAMRMLVAAATELGAAKHPHEVARVLAAAAGALLPTGAVSVHLPTRDDLPAPDGRTDAPAGRPGHRIEVPLPVLRPDSRGAAAGRAAASAGRIVCELRAPLRSRDQPRLSTLELLAVEAGRVLGRLELAEQLELRSRTDPLTGLGNRTVLDSALAGAITGSVVVLLDLDHFKAVNDTFGHVAGDQVLVRFADVLRSTQRSDQAVARYGGEEFALVLAGLPPQGLARHLLAVRRAWLAEDPLTTYSAGVAVLRPGESGTAALARADLALYRAKAAGRDRDHLDLDPDVDPDLDPDVDRPWTGARVA